MYVKPSTYGQHYLNEIHAYFFLIATFNRTMFFKNNVSVTYNNILIISYVKFYIINLSYYFLHDIPTSLTLM